MAAGSPALRMSPRRVDGLPTARELEILEALSRPGAKRSTVAAELGISEFTVDAHLRSLYRRLGVNSATQAAVRVAGSR